MNVQPMANGRQEFQRRDGWENRLTHTVARAMTRPYAIGRHDCFLFACACAEALTGIDFAAHLKGRYRTRIGALKLIQTLGGPVKAITSLLGVEAQGARLARRGDWLLYRDEAGEHIGVCLGSSIAVLAENGLHAVAFDDCLCSWPLG